MFYDENKTWNQCWFTLAPPFSIVLHIPTLSNNDLPITRSRGRRIVACFSRRGVWIRKFSFLDMGAINRVAPSSLFISLNFDTIMNEWRGGITGGGGGEETLGVASANSFYEAPGFLAQKPSRKRIVPFDVRCASGCVCQRARVYMRACKT